MDTVVAVVAEVPFSVARLEGSALEIVPAFGVTAERFSPMTGVAAIAAVEAVAIPETTEATTGIRKNLIFSSLLICEYLFVQVTA